MRLLQNNICKGLFSWNLFWINKFINLNFFSQQSLTKNSQYYNIKLTFEIVVEDKGEYNGECKSKY